MDRRVLSTVLCLVLFSSTFAAPSARVVSLGTYNIEAGSITTSGISSGAGMATQFHVIHSSAVHGAGIFAGVPYGCSLGLVAESLNCMLYPGLTIMANLYARTNTYDLYGSIDSTSNLADDRVFVFHGLADSVVNPGSGDNVQEFYNHYGATVSKKMDLAAQHCMPTDSYGTICDQLNTENYINNCSYRGAYEMMNYLYGGGLARPQGNEGILSNLYEFDQGEFFGAFSSPSSASMDNIGYVYVPTSCATGARCKLHVAFHGCLQGRGEVGTSYVVHGGYLEPAERNNIIVLFPQVIKSTLAGNPQGCWDWWGYTNFQFDTRNGVQVDAVKQMVDRITGFVV